MESISDFLGDNVQKVVFSLALLVLVFAIRFLVLRALLRRIDDSEASFRARKSSLYVATALSVLGLGAIWISQLGNVGSFLGLFAAGVAIALSDVLKNMAGWLYIIIRRPFKAGDRIEIGPHAGDVIDIRMFRFSILEIRNWVQADQSTGRIIHVPNGLLFTHPAANFTEGFPFIWHEIGVTITFESDWERARDLVQEVIEEHAPDPKEAGAVADLEKASMHYFIRYRHLTPTVYVRVLDSGVQVTGRLLVPARQRRTVDSEVWSGILHAFAAEPSVELAYPTIRHYRADREKGAE